MRVRGHSRSNDKKRVLRAPTCSSQREVIKFWGRFWNLFEWLNTLSFSLSLSSTTSTTCTSLSLLLPFRCSLWCFWFGWVWLHQNYYWFEESWRKPTKNTSLWAVPVSPARSLFYVSFLPIRYLSDNRQWSSCLLVCRPGQAKRATVDLKSHISTPKNQKVGSFQPWSNFSLLFSYQKALFLRGMGTMTQWK